MLGRPPRTAYVPERFPPALPFTALEYLRLMGRVHGLPGAETERRGAELLARFGAEEHAGRPLAGLSKGTCQKVAVVQALLAEPGLLVLDEAWTGLDAGSRTALDEAVEQRVAEGSTVVFVDHDPARLADRTDLRWAVDGGTVTVTRQAAAAVVRIDCTGVAGGPEDLAALPGVRMVSGLADGTVRLETDETHSDELLRTLLTDPDVHISPGERRAEVIALLRYHAVLLLRSQRWLPPVLLYAGTVGISLDGQSQLGSQLGWNAAVSVPALAWLTRSQLTAEPPAARACLAARPTRKLSESHRDAVSASLLAANADLPSPPYRGRQHAVIGAPPPTAPMAAPLPLPALRLPLTGRNFPDIGDSSEVSFSGSPPEGAHVPSRRTVLAASAGVTAALAVGGTAHAGTPDDKKLRALISRMTLEEKVGQLFVMRVYGHSATAPDQADIDANLKEIGVRTAAELIARYRVGGIIYFTWAHNTRDPHQIADLSNGIQRASLDQPRGLPVLISTDQEHGIVCRVGEPATLFPGAMAIGAGGSRTDARTLGRIAGQELRALGIRQNYSPVADVNVNPANPVIGVRSFGAEPDAVAGLVAAEVAGYQRAGVAATAKHFPGHGDTAVDSHYGFPVITHTREQWEKLDAPPFRAAIRAGIDSIMTAHIMVPALDDSGDPATLSHPILTGILREELGYDGLVVTDSLGMEGVRTKYGDDRVPVLALKAGVDQLLNPPSLDVAWNAVLKAVQDGELTEARLDESILRVLRLKAKLRLFASRTSARAASTGPSAPRRTSRPPTGSPSGRRPCWSTRGGCCPCPGAPTASCSSWAPTRPPRPARPGPPTGVSPPPSPNWASRPPPCRPVRRPPPPPSPGPSPPPSGADAVIVGTYNVTATSTQKTLVEQLVATGRPVVAVAIRNPYDVAQLPAVPAYLAPTPGPTSNCGRPRG